MAVLRADCETRDHLPSHSSSRHHLSAAPGVSGISVPKLGVSSPGYYRYRQRRHSGLDYVSPIEFELTSNHTTKTA